MAVALVAPEDFVGSTIFHECAVSLSVRNVGNWRC
jgi:hypothetical protein